MQPVIDVCLQVTGRAITVIEGERREGDPRCWWLIHLGRAQSWAGSHNMPI